MGKKWVLWGGVAALFGLFLMQTKKLSDFYNNLSINVKLQGSPSVKGGLLGFLEIPFRVEFGNRSSQVISIMISSVKLLYKGIEIGDIRPQAGTITLNPYANTSTGVYQFQLSFQKLISSGAAGNIISAIVAGNFGVFSTLANEMKVVVSALVNNIPVKHEENLGTGGTAGLGLVATSKRKIGPKSDYSHLIASLGSLEKTDPVINPDGDVDETVALMIDIVKKTPADTQKLAKELRDSSLEKTLENIFSFVYKYIEYELDSPLFEQLRRPLRTLHDQKGDCDCYSILIGSILYNLGIPFKFRVTAYNNGPRFQHVYVVVPKSSGGYYTIDPVLDRFNEEKPFTRKKDFSL